MNVFVVNKKLLWAFATLIRVQRSRVKDNASEDRAFLLLCIFSNLFLGIFYFLVAFKLLCLLLVKRTSTWERLVLVFASCRLDDFVAILPSLQSCLCAISFSLPCCPVCSPVCVCVQYCFFALLSHVQSCLCWKWSCVQYCHGCSIVTPGQWSYVFNIVFCSMLPSVTWSVLYMQYYDVL